MKSAKQTCCGGFVLAHVATHAIWLHHCGGCVKRHLQLQDLMVHKLALPVLNEEGISTTQVARPFYSDGVTCFGAGDFPKPWPANHCLHSAATFALEDHLRGPVLQT